MVVLSIFFEIFFYVNNTSFFFHWHLFFYFISNNNCRLLTINIVSFIFFYYRESKPPFYLHYEKRSLVNIVYRKINWQNPASISAYTQSEYRISNYVNHIRIIFQSPKTIKTWTTNIMLHWINGIIWNNKCISTKLNAVFNTQNGCMNKKILQRLIPSQIPDRFSKLLCSTAVP
jgi:hypothetical protein